MSHDANPFLVRSEDEHRKCVAQMLTLILGNHINSRVWDRYKRTGELVVNPEDLVLGASHLLDRSGAIVNSILGMGYAWDASDFNQELQAQPGAESG